MERNSQSSDFLSDSIELSSTPVHQMDTDFESLVASTKLRLGVNLRKEPQNASLINVLLTDCSSCVNQSLCLIRQSLLESSVCLDKVIKLLKDAVDLLQVLSGFIKMAIEFLSMNSRKMKTYPTATGTIILDVFTHCKDSESLYGRNLSASVEKVLRDLFNSCHELQLTYLMILERHFIFDETNVEEKNILVEALDINLKIGEIVHALDAKPTAVQWKAYIGICEKYSNTLTDVNTFENTVQVICGLIKKNVEIIYEDDDIKMASKSLKVASFFIKILQKECEIFKQAAKKNYEYLALLLFYIIQSRWFHLELSVDAVQFVNLLLNPSERFFKELLLDEVFANTLINYDLNKVKQEEILVGYILSLASIMESLTTGTKGNTIITKPIVIHCLYKILPFCTSDQWDSDIQISQEQQKSRGLFDHLLINAAALAFTFTSEEYSLLEKYMIEAILGTYGSSAMFSTNLWHVLSLARNTNPQLLFNQIVWLCTMYKKFEKHGMFHLSPQKIHLTHTISRLFDVLEDEDKLKIRKQFRIHDDDNVSLWTALGVRTLPNEAKTSAEEVVTDKLKTQFQCAVNSGDYVEVKKLTKLMSLAATCDFTNPTTIEHLVIKAWTKTCLKNQFTIQDIDAGTVWFYDYLKALLQITDSMWNKLSLDNGNLVTILHCVTVMIQQSSVEYQLLLIDVLCKIAASQINHTKHVDENFTQAFTCLSQDTELVNNKLFITLKQYRHDNNMNKMLSTGEFSLRDIWTKITNGRNLHDYEEKWEGDTRFTHKCFKSTASNNTTVVSVIKQSSGNFDFAENVDFFENNSDIEEPECKKMKLDNSEAELIVKRMENDANLLCTMKANVSLAEFKSRLENVCDKLRNVID